MGGVDPLLVLHRASHVRLVHVHGEGESVGEQGAEEGEVEGDGAGGAASAEHVAEEAAAPAESALDAEGFAEVGLGLGFINEKAEGIQSNLDFFASEATVPCRGCNTIVPCNMLQL